jgi:hypothetical protein
MVRRGRVVQVWPGDHITEMDISLLFDIWVASVPELERRMINSKKSDNFFEMKGRDA